VIQDGRPALHEEPLIAATIEAAREIGAAVAAQPITDTVKESADGKLIERTLDRARLWAVQNTTDLRVEVIRRALGEVRRQGLLVTDDTAACELIGQQVKLWRAASRIRRLRGRRICVLLRRCCGWREVFGAGSGSEATA